MTDQVRFLRVILDNKLDWKAHLENRMRVDVLWERFEDYHRGALAIYFRGEAHSFVWWKRVELKNARKRLSHLQRMTYLGIIDGMRSTPTSALEVMLMLHLFIKQEARQAANVLLGNGCSYMPNFGDSEVLIRMTDETPLLLAPRDKFVTFNIFGRKFSVDFPTREDWSTECFALVAPVALVFFIDGSLCEGIAGAGVFSEILNVRESYGLGSHARVFHFEVYATLACSEYCILEGIVNRAVSICSDSRGALLALKSYVSCLSELYYSAGICFRNWFYLTEFNWYGFLDTMEMRRPTHLQERAKVLFL
jgi:hypothetical protein